MEKMNESQVKQDVFVLYYNLHYFQIVVCFLTLHYDTFTHIL